jgi:protein O-mannose beta-1,4-N-acetylglucosaminyltransferase
MENTVVSLPSSALSSIKVKWVNETTLVFKPFLSGNLMHMFHDDIIPLHHTLKLLTMGNRYEKNNHPFDVRLFIFDDEFDVDDEVKQFYEVFSRFKIKSKQDFQGNEMTCFRSIFIGLSRATTWYDYGFASPQGPILDRRVQSSHIKSTVTYLRQHLPIPSILNSQEYILLFSRKENRKIINEMELTMKILRTFGIKVMNLNFESYSLLELISYTSHSKGVIAMHGSLLILSMFLNPGCFIIELFPYAINPSNYTPYKTLSQLNGMGLIYKAWTNQIKENSIGHPDWPAESGGLVHLEEDKRETILHQTEVPPHLCCNDPSWLYHIYQDTVVNSSDISDLLQEVLSESLAMKKAANNSGNLLHPSKVKNVSCHISYADNSGKQDSNENKTRFLSVKWDIPWTTFYMKFESLHYEILFQSLDSDSDKTSTFVSSNNKFVIDTNCSGKCHVWIRAVINSYLTGVYSKATLCQPDFK